MRKKRCKQIYKGKSRVLQIRLGMPQNFFLVCKSLVSLMISQQWKVYSFWMPFDTLAGMQDQSSELLRSCKCWIICLEMAMSSVIIVVHGSNNLCIDWLVGGCIYFESCSIPMHFFIGVIQELTLHQKVVSALNND